MGKTMTWIGLDVHARSVHAALVDAETGELRRQRLGGQVEEVVGFLAEQRGPVQAVYEAGPTGFGLARAAAAAGVEVMLVAPGKTPRAAADRIKTDQRDAELLVRLLMAGSLRAIHLPSVAQEAARDLVRAREALRQDLMRARHRVSKLLLRYGRVYPKDRGTWTVAHRDWLAAQRFDEPALELAYLDALASVDGLMARRAVLEQHLAPRDERGAVAGRRAAACLSWDRHADRARARLRDRRLHTLRARSGTIGLARAGAEHLPKRRAHQPGCDHEDRLAACPAAARRGRLALPAPTTRRPSAAKPPGRPTRGDPADRLARPASPLPHPHPPT